MKYINIDTPVGLIRIQVVNNAFTEKYFPMLKTLVSHFPILHGPHASGIYRSNLTGSDKQYQTFDQYYEIQDKKLQVIIDELNTMGCNFPYRVDANVLKRKDVQTQRLCNRLHRAFTTAHRCHSQNTSMHWSDTFASQFIVPKESMSRFIELIDQINCIVHYGIEPYTNTPRKTIQIDQAAWQYDFWADCWIPGTSQLYNKHCWEVLQPEDFQYFSDSKEFDVWVGKDILGKDHVTAYHDYDDPTEWDVTSIVGYSGKIAMDVGNITHRDLVLSDDFQKWLSEYGVPYSPVMCGMPIGTIVEGHDVVQQLFDDFQKDFLKNFKKVQPAPVFSFE